MKNVIIVEHPLVRHNLTCLRNKNTQHLEFRRLLGEISLLMSYEIARSFETREVQIQTPLEDTAGTCLIREVALIPVLRAGLGTVSYTHLDVYKRQMWSCAPPRTATPALS